MVFFKYRKNVILCLPTQKNYGASKIFSVHHLFVTIDDLKYPKNSISKVLQPSNFFFQKVNHYKGDLSVELEV